MGERLSYMHQSISEIFVCVEIVFKGANTVGILEDLFICLRIQCLMWDLSFLKTCKTPQGRYRVGV